MCLCKDFTARTIMVVLLKDSSCEKVQFFMWLKNSYQNIKNSFHVNVHMACTVIALLLTYMN